MSVDIGGKIKEMRKSRGMTQGELARRSGVAQSTLSYIEKGDKYPRFETLSAICKGLHVSVFKLLSYGEKKSRTKLLEAQLLALSSGKDGGNTADLEKYLYEKLLQTDNDQ